MNIPPLSCDMSVLTPVERDQHIQVTRNLLQSLQDTVEVEDGFVFIFPEEPEILERLARFISKERLCCPFLEFSLSVAPNPAPIWLTITGPEGTQEFLREEFSEAFA